MAAPNLQQPMMIPYYGMGLTPQFQQHTHQTSGNRQIMPTGPGQAQHHPQQPQPVPFHASHAYPNHHFVPSAQMLYPQHTTMNGSFTISHDEVMLLQQLKHQVEFYFSPQNLENDTYLLEQLNATDHIGAVPVETICNFRKIREMVHSFYAARMGFVPQQPAPMAPPQILQSALRLEFAGSPRTQVVALSDDGLWINPKQAPWQKRADSDNRNLATHRKKPSDLPASVGSGGGSASSLTTISGNSASVSGVYKDDGTATVFTTKESVATAILTVSTASAPSSPSSQASSVGIRTRPLPQQKERNIVIVRDIPIHATIEEVVEALSTDDIQPKGARPDVGNTWYVTFESEEHAVSALSQSRENTIAGVPVLGRLKSETISAPRSSSILSIATVERSNSISSSIGPPGPPPMAPLPPSMDQVATAASSSPGEDKGTSGTDSVSAAPDSSGSAPAHAPIMQTQHMQPQHMHHQYPIFPPRHQSAVPVRMPPGYGFVTLPPMYGMPQGLVSHMSEQQRVLYFPQQAFPFMQQQQQQQHHLHQQQRFLQQQQHIHQSNAHISYHVLPPHTTASKQPRQQQQPRSIRSVTSSTTDRSQRDGSHQQPSSTPPQHVFLKHVSIKKKNRDTCESENSAQVLHAHQQLPKHDVHPDQQGVLPPTGKTKKKTKRKSKNKLLQSNSADHDVDFASVSSRNSCQHPINNNTDNTNGNFKSKPNGPNANKDNINSKKPPLGDPGKTLRRPSGNNIPIAPPKVGSGGRKTTTTAYDGKGNGNKISSGSKKSTNGKKNKKNGKEGSPGSIIELNVVDFPALWVDAESKTPQKSPRTTATGKEPRPWGYAQALLKQPAGATADPPQVDTQKRAGLARPSPISPSKTTNEIQSKLDRFALSGEAPAAASYDDR